VKNRSIRQCIQHVRHGSIEQRQLLRRGIKCSQCRNLTFNQRASLQLLDRTIFSEFSQGVLRRLANIHAAASANFNEPGNFERNQGLTHRRPTHAQLRRQIPLGRQISPWRETAITNAVGNQIGDLPVQALGLQRRQDGFGHHIHHTFRTGNTAKAILTEQLFRIATASPKRPEKTKSQLESWLFVAKQNAYFFIASAWIAVSAMVKTMSSTSAPRDRSFTGLRKPCNIGPTETTLALRCTAL